MIGRHRLAIVVSHPIQHFVHLYRALALHPDIQLKVFFCSRIGLERYFDREMNTEIAWEMDLLGGYEHAFLDEAPRIERTTWRSVNNPSVTAVLATFGPTAVMIYGYAYPTALRALLWCRLHGVPALMTGDGDNVQTRSWRKNAVRQGVLRPLLSQVSAFLTVGDQNEAMLAGLGVRRNRMFRSPFTIDEAVYRDHHAAKGRIRGEARAELGIADDAFVPIFVGKLSARKRPLDLVDACAMLHHTNPAMHLLICGEGAERAGLEARIASTGIKATMAGFVNVDRLPRMFCAGDVLVHPSEHDPHPLVCSEAAAIGLPLILSDRVGAIGPTDVARAGENALVVPWGDVAAIAGALKRLLSETGLQGRMSASSLDVFDQVDQQHSVAGILRALEATGSASGALAK